MKKLVKKPVQSAGKAPQKPKAKLLAKKKRPAKAKGAASEAGAATEMDPRFAQVAAAFAKDRTVTAGRMMSSFGLKVNGKIFAMVSRSAFVVKLPKARVDELVSAKQGVYFDPRRDGRLMKEWLSVADRKAPWLELAKEAHRFVKAVR